MEEYLVSKRAYSPPQLSRIQAKVFSEVVWESSGEDEPFRRLRPFFLVYRMQEFTPLAVRLKFEGDKEYRDWQAVGAVPALHSDELREEASHGWILLGYVPPAVRFEAKLSVVTGKVDMGLQSRRTWLQTETKRLIWPTLKYRSLRLLLQMGIPALELMLELQPSTRRT